MAIVRNGASGSVSGKVGALVYVQTKRGDYVRSLPRLKKGRKPTPAQLESRKRFAVANRIISELAIFIRKGFAQCDPPRRAYDCAMSYILKNAVAETERGYVIYWEKFAIAKGLPNPVTSYHLELNKAQSLLRITWEFDALMELKYDLRGYESQVLLYPAEEGKSLLPLRHSGYYLLGQKQQEVRMPAQNATGRYHVYLFFFATDTSNRSTDSLYLGTVEW